MSNGSDVTAKYTRLLANMDQSQTLENYHRVLAKTTKYLSKHVYLHLYLVVDNVAKEGLKTMVEYCKKFTRALEDNSSSLDSHQRANLERRNIAIHRAFIFACAECEAKLAALKAQSKFMVARDDYETALTAYENSLRPCNSSRSSMYAYENSGATKLIRRKRKQPTSDSSSEEPRPVAAQDETNVSDIKKPKLV